MVKSLARGNKCAVIRECFEDADAEHFLIAKIETVVRTEVKAMCSDKQHSILQGNSSEDLKQFSCEKVLSEMKSTPPLLTAVLMAATHTRTGRESRVGVVGSCAAMLLKFRHKRMCLLQKRVALILYSGHSSKQVLV